MWIKYPVETVSVKAKQISTVMITKQITCQLLHVILKRNIHNIYHKWNDETNLAIILYINVIQIKHQIPIICSFIMFLLSTSLEHICFF